MSKLTVYDEHAHVLKNTDNLDEIAAILQQAGILFTQWEANYPIVVGMSNEDILKAYQHDINALVTQGGYLTVDVVSMHAEHPDKAPLRQKFLSEHTHTEDEIRFFVEGAGLFYVHIGPQVFSVLCCKNDLVSVPAGTPHWFDMGEHPTFTAIRFFNNKEGWVAQYTTSKIADTFPRLEL